MKIIKLPPMKKSKRKLRSDDLQHWRKNSGRRGAQGLSNKLKFEHEQLKGRKA